MPAHHVDQVSIWWCFLKHEANLVRVRVLLPWAAHMQQHLQNIMDQMTNVQLSGARKLLFALWEIYNNFVWFHLNWAACTLLKIAKIRTLIYRIKHLNKLIKAKWSLKIKYLLKQSDMFVTVSLRRNGNSSSLSFLCFSFKIIALVLSQSCWPIKTFVSNRPTGRGAVAPYWRQVKSLKVIHSESQREPRKTNHHVWPLQRLL